LRGVPGEISPQPTLGRAAVLGFANMVLVATRPEAAVVVAAFGISAAVSAARGVSRIRGMLVLLVSSVPGAAVILAHALANRFYTGDFSAAGALVKLELHDPKLTAVEVWKQWGSHVVYQVARICGRHLAGNPYVGAVTFVVCAVPLFSHRTRRYAAVLWVSALSWVAVVALNGQVRWQNERYTMPALAWLLLAGAMGLGVLCAPLANREKRPVSRFMGAAVAVVFLCGLVVLQRPRFRDQLWFFGRASRNIFEQHVKAARVLRALRPLPKRVAVGDAGAIPYESRLPSLDIIGLGGYAGLPFAQATRWGIASAIELIERMPRSERPDVLALYPTWWGELPVWFGKRMGGISVRGNVICGGQTKMIYQADWRALDRSAFPATRAGRVVDTLDLADVLSEREHGFELTSAVGFVTMKILAHPVVPAEPLWDAGRILPQGSRARFALRGFEEQKPATVLLRIAPSQRARLAVSIGGGPKKSVELKPQDAWVEMPFEAPASQVGPVLDVVITVEENEAIVYHVFGLQKP
jgi:hypothetical protein